MDKRLVFELVLWVLALEVLLRLDENGTFVVFGIPVFDSALFVGSAIVAVYCTKYMVGFVFRTDNAESGSKSESDRSAESEEKPSDNG